MHWKCRAQTRLGHPCTNSAWWKGGLCPRHFDRSWTFGDWLAGYGDGLAWPGSLPELRAIAVILDGEWPHGIRPSAPRFTIILAQAGIPTCSRTMAKPNLSNPRVAVCFGNHGSSWSSLRPRCAADVATAQVQVDEAIGLGRLRADDPSHVRVLRRFMEVVADANAVSDALASGQPLPAVSRVLYGDP